VRVADPYLTLLREWGKLPEMGRRQPCSTTRWRLEFLALLAPYSGKPQPTVLKAVGLLQALAKGSTLDEVEAAVIGGLQGARESPHLLRRECDSPALTASTG
jgi:hypothetical protein